MILGFIAVVLVVGVLSALLGAHLYKRSSSWKDKEIAYYQGTYLRKQGFAIGFDDYELLSFNGGKRWYAVIRDGEGAVVIRGSADEVFPGLLEHLQGMDALIAYAKKNGPITLVGPNASAELKVLQRAGFMVMRE